MVDQFRVKLEGRGATADRHRRALATLPAHFRIVAGGAEVTLLTAGTNAPTSAVVLADDIMALPADALGAATIAALRYAPRLAAAGLSGALATAPFALLDLAARADGDGTPALATALFEQLAALRLLSGGPPAISGFQRFAGGYVGSCRLAGFPDLAVTLSCVAAPTGSSELIVDLVGTRRRVHAALDGGVSARVADIEIHGDVPLAVDAPYQSSERLTWLAVHRLLSGGVAPYGGAALCEDVAEVRRYL